MEFLRSKPVQQARHPDQQISIETSGPARRFQVTKVVTSLPSISSPQPFSASFLTAGRPDKRV
jgi:hypothetical protein